MIGLDLVAGYLVAWVARKAGRVGKRLDAETDAVVDAALDRLHDMVAEKLGSESALVKLETEASQGAEPSERTMLRVRYAVEEATEEDPQFADVLEAVLAELERARAGGSPGAGIDLRGAQGVQVGNQNTQTNTFN